MTDPPDDTTWMKRALDRAVRNVKSGNGGPFAALVVENGTVLSEGVNRVTDSNDPTAHAEIVAIRAACRERGHFELDGCTLYTTCEPCPMCLGAVYWSRLDRVVYAATRSDAAEAGFDDHHIYDEIQKTPSERRLEMERVRTEEAGRPFRAWRQFDERVEY